MKKVLFLLSLLVFVSSGYAATIYRWVDGRGSVHFADDYTLVPPQYRDQVKTEEMEDSQQIGTPPPPVSPPSEKSGVVTRDAYGMGEDYWRDRVRPWQNQLKEAQANIQSVDARIKGLSDGISGRFLSSTQRNMYTSQLQTLNGEKARYEAQANEATEMLNKMAREAEETKADPAWLK